MNPEESGNILRDILRDSCETPADFLSNKDLHKEYFRKTESARGFFEGIEYLLHKKHITQTKDHQNCHQLTKAGRNAD